MAHPLDADIRAFEQQQEELRRHHDGKYVIFHKGALVGAFDSFDAAAKHAVSTLEVPYLIRQVGGSDTMPMPASVAFRPVHATA